MSDLHHIAQRPKPGVELQASKVIWPLKTEISHHVQILWSPKPKQHLLYTKLPTAPKLSWRNYKPQQGAIHGSTKAGKLP